MMMLHGFSAVLLVGMVVLVDGELMPVDDTNWWEMCKGPVCTVAESQAEGLARLRVLSNYIRETMSLMESVVTSLDNEMEEVGRELSDMVGRRCYARGHAALSALVTHMNQADQTDNGILEITSDNNDSGTDASDLTQGSVDEEEDFPRVSQGTSRRPSVTSRGTYRGTSHRPDSTLSSTQGQTTSPTTGNWRGVSRYPSSTSDSPRHGSYSYTSSTSRSTASQSRDTTSPSSGKTLHRRPSGTLKKYEALPTDEAGSVYVSPAQPDSIHRQREWGGGGGGRYGHRRGNWHGSGHGRGGGMGHSDGHGDGHGAGGGGSVSAELGTSGCRGVPVGSPSFVPGLDSWCVSNCAVGNCPPTHCICS